MDENLCICEVLFMLIRMDYLLHHYFSHLDAKESDDKAFVDIRSIHVWDGSYSKHASPVYILFASQHEELDFTVSDDPWVLICIEDIPVPEFYEELDQVHMIRLPKSCSVAKASNAMTSLLASTADSLDLFNQILNVVTHPSTRPTFAESISQMIGCPVALVDDSFNTLSAASSDLTSEDWLSFLAQKQRMVTHLPQNYNYEGFSISPLSQIHGRYGYEVLFPLYADNTTKDLEGAIYFLSPDLVLPTNYSEILHYTAHALSWVLWKHVRQSQGSHATLNHPLIMTLVEMLYGGSPEDEKIEQVLSTCTYNVNRDFVLLVVEDSAALSTAINPDSVANTLIGLFPEGLTLCFSGDVVTLLPAFYLQDEAYKDLWKKFSAYLTEIQCFAGLSTVFHSVDKYFLHHYIRAMSAARIARETLMEDHYSTFSENPIFNILADGIPPSNLIGLCDPDLLKLIEHDKKFGTEYYYTLCCYWQLDRNHTRVCNYMHIHKNTLYYRIAKMKVLLHQDIDRHTSFLQLTLSIAILEALGITPRYRISDEESEQQKWLYNYESLV